MARLKATWDYCSCFLSLCFNGDNCPVPIRGGAVFWPQPWPQHSVKSHVVHMLNCVCVCSLVVAYVVGNDRPDNKRVERTNDRNLSLYHTGGRARGDHWALTTTTYAARERETVITSLINKTERESKQTFVRKRPRFAVHLRSLQCPVWCVCAFVQERRFVRKMDVVLYTGRGKLPLILNGLKTNVRRANFLVHHTIWPTFSQVASGKGYHTTHDKSNNANNIFQVTRVAYVLDSCAKGTFFSLATTLSDQLQDPEPSRENRLFFLQEAPSTRHRSGMHLICSKSWATDVVTFDFSSSPFSTSFFSPMSRTFKVIEAALSGDSSQFILTLFTTWAGNWLVNSSRTGEMSSIGLERWRLDLQP